MSTFYPDPYASSDGRDAALTKTDLAYRRIRQEIVEGKLIPGEVIDQETIATRLGFSTTPIREALRLLESESLVVSRPHRNTVVAPVDLALMEETYTVRLYLDPAAAALAAANATDEQRDQIEKLADEISGNLDPVHDLHANRRLHRAIYRASNNSILIGILDSLWDRTDRYRLLLLRDGSHARGADDEHRALVQAVLRRDPNTASTVMHQHVATSLAHLQSRRLGAEAVPKP